MIVYVESNFILEMVLSQEQHISARTMLSMAEKREIELAFPSFVLSEVFSTVVRRQKERLGIYTSLEKNLGEIKRSENYKEIALSMEFLVAELRKVVGEENDLLQKIVEKVFNVGRSIETDLPILIEAPEYQNLFDLSLPDSIIYATIINDLKKRPEKEEKRFLSRDAAAYSSDPGTQKRNKDKFESKRRIKVDLKKYNCLYFLSFEDALENIKSLVGREDSI